MNVHNFIASTVDSGNMLGKLLYYSLSRILVDKTRLSQICDETGFPYTPSKRTAVADAFKSATGDIFERFVVKEYGETHIFRVYCRDNKRGDGNVLSRELVKETMGVETNQYKKLANISFHKEDGYFSYDNMVYDTHVDAMKNIREAEQLFELYQQCVSRKQIETILENYLSSMQAVKATAHGKLFFVPKHELGRLEVFEDFIAALEAANCHPNITFSALEVNSIFVTDDLKQREKMAEAYYSDARREIAEYQERMKYLLDSGCESAAIMDRWRQKVSALEDKKRNYEDILRRELDGLDDEFTSLHYLSEEFEILIRGIGKRKAA